MKATRPPLLLGPQRMETQQQEDTLQIRLGGWEFSKSSGSGPNATFAREVWGSTATTGPEEKGED